MSFYERESGEKIKRKYSPFIYLIEKPFEAGIGPPEHSEITMLGPWYGFQTHSWWNPLHSE